MVLRWIKAFKFAHSTAAWLTLLVLFIFLVFFLFVGYVNYLALLPIALVTYIGAFFYPTGKPRGLFINK